ncbi:MAG: acyl-ACP--UDP-N-acetylglucosamine O-acyltransferase [Endomicrobia bacterium]|nr:acyl-ACP--UDP-N-acetylglucosamine O-acyltransferase [Endomicrobiia bacterium]MCL2506886.1 acyl-ACP--UDP-N-acetylglucosamine O-acyltransferase [Endomicrobiia bacterium]
MIHQTAVIDKSAIIEDNVEIGPNVVIGKDVIIKSGSSIGANSYIEFAEIGKNCKIFNSVSVGTSPQDLSYKDESAKVYIGDNTTLREFVNINRGTKKTEKTIIGQNCYFMASSHAAHDCRVGDNVIIGNCTMLGGHVHVGDNAFLSGLVGVHQFCKIGKGVMVAGGSIITMDVIHHAMCHGDRAVLSGLNLVGMKRRKMTADEIQNIKEAYKILFMSKLLLNDALAKLENSESCHVREIVDFIKTSKRGILRPE